MNSHTKNLNFWFQTTPLLLFLLLLPSLALNSDGVSLLSLKYSILSDPLSVLETWNYNDQTPCSWTGVTCTQIGLPGTPDMFRVTAVFLPGSRLLGSIPADLGSIQYLRHLDLSENFFNGSLPSSIFNASNLQVLSLSNNVISGELPELVGGLRNLEFLNLSDNAFAGKIPNNLSDLQNLTVVSLRSNYFSGSVSGLFKSVDVLDLSSNLLNGSLPLDFGGNGLRYLNLSYNKISGEIPPEFAKGIPENATIDLSFNNLTGAIPENLGLHNQRTEFFAGNVDLCGKPLKKLCSIPSTRSTPPNVSTSSSSPAIAAIPKTIGSIPVTTSTPNTQNSAQNQEQGGLKPSTIAGITVGDLAGIGILAMVILFAYQMKKKKRLQSMDSLKKLETITKQHNLEDSGKPTACSCLTIKTQEASETTSSESEVEDRKEVIQKGGGGPAVVVAVDGETELELETLLKASAYILGASGKSIVYKAVLEDGTALAVRRIGDGGGDWKMKDFEGQVRAVAKLRHPNLVRVRGFYWGEDEKLVIYDYVSHGSLASSGHRKIGSSPLHLTLEVRLKIARGVARGLSYIHDKKQVHGNIKPSNILLNSDMEPIIADFGLDRLISSTTAAATYKDSNSARHFGSQELPAAAGSPYAPAAAGSSAAASTSPYQAPESLRNLKPNPKWDVYSLGVVLLELLTGRVFSGEELGQWAAGLQPVGEEKNQVLRMADVAIRADVEAREDALLACFKLGFSCASLIPQRRPSMKEALQVLEKISCSSSS